LSFLPTQPRSRSVPAESRDQTLRCYCRGNGRAEKTCEFHRQSVDNSARPAQEGRGVQIIYCTRLRLKVHVASTGTPLLVVLLT
jgi:hypothetical protein